MALLEQDLQNKIDEKRFGANKFFKTDKGEYFKLKQEAWDLYPDPKNNWNEAYALARDFFKVYLFEANFDKAKEWLNKMIDHNNNLHLFDGDVTFNVGKYYFETGDYKTALEKWQSVVKDAGLRYFENEKKEYLDFYNKPESLLRT